MILGQLAGEIGVSPMTPYRYFKGKDAVLAAVRARGFDRHAEALERAYDESELKPGDRGLPVGVAYVRFALENAEAYKLMLDIRQPTKADYPDLMRAEPDVRRLLDATMTALGAVTVADGWAPAATTRRPKA